MPIDILQETRGKSRVGVKFSRVLRENRALREMGCGPESVLPGRGNGSQLPKGQIRNSKFEVRNKSEIRKTGNITSSGSFARWD